MSAPITHHCARCHQVVEWRESSTYTRLSGLVTERPGYWRDVNKQSGNRWCGEGFEIEHVLELPPDMANRPAVERWLAR